MTVHPCAGFARLRENRGDHVGMLLREIARRLVEVVGRREARVIGQRADLQRVLRGRVIRVPDSPRVDVPAFEGGTRIGGRQVDRADLVVAHAGLVQRFEQQVVRARAFLQRDALAAQLGHRADRRIGLHEHGLVVRRRRFRADVHEAHAGRLREHGRRRARIAEVDTVRVQRFEQLRAGRKLEPLHVVAERLQPRFERMLRVDDREQPGLLIADAYDLARARRRADGRGRQGDECGGDGAGDPAGETNHRTNSMRDVFGERHAARVEESSHGRWRPPTKQCRYEYESGALMLCRRCRALRAHRPAARLRR